MSFPSEKQIKKALENINDEDFVKVLPKNASRVDKTKYELCGKFVKYLLDRNISQAELAREIKVDRSRINWIVKYKIENFTIDRLYELWTIIDPSFQLRVS